MLLNKPDPIDPSKSAVGRGPLNFHQQKLQLLQHGQDFEVRIQMQVSNGSKKFFSFILHLQKL